MDGQTERCAHCGTPTTEGRFCTNCGAELGTEPTNPRVWPAPSGPATTPATTPASTPATTPVATPAPTAGKGIVTDTAERSYGVPPAGSAGTSSAPAYPPPEPPYLAPTPGPPPRAGLGPGIWVALVVTMVLVLVLGAFLLFHGGGSPTVGSTAPPSQSSGSAPSSRTSSSPSSPSPSSTASGRVTGPPANVAGFAQVSAPRHAPPAVDFAGRPVTYVAANLVDGRNDTCWRTPGNATGTVITFRLDQPTRLTRVGLVNGYSKIAYSRGRAYDWYLGNRRVTAVDWTFDDGTSVSQTLGKNRNMQQIAIPPVTTRTVRLVIRGVTPPGKGRAARNDTAISEVLLLGRTASG